MQKAAAGGIRISFNPTHSASTDNSPVNPICTRLVGIMGVVRPRTRNKSSERDSVTVTVAVAVAVAVFCFCNNL
jgi:hypothetical protein